MCSEDTVKLQPGSDDEMDDDSSKAEPGDLREDPELPHGSAMEAKDVDVERKVSRISFLILYLFLRNRSAIHHHYFPYISISHIITLIHFRRKTAGSNSKTFFETNLFVSFKFNK